MGAAIPGDQLEKFYSNAFSWSFGYGYRLIPYLQADVGLDSAYNAANVNSYMPSGWGPLRIRDFQFFVPMGGRVVAPLAHGRVEIYGGGGGAYIRYTEMLSQPDQWTNIGCPPCQARDGWGYYALLGGDVALDRGQHFRLGATTRLYRGETNGASVGTLPPVRTQDRWINTYFGLTFSF